MCCWWLAICSLATQVKYLNFYMSLCSQSVLGFSLVMIQIVTDKFESNSLVRRFNRLSPVMSHNLVFAKFWAKFAKPKV